MGWLQMVLADEAGLTCRGVMTWRFSGQFMSRPVFKSHTTVLLYLYTTDLILLYYSVHIYTTVLLYTRTVEYSTTH